MKTETATKILAEYIAFGDLRSDDLYAQMAEEKLATTKTQWEQYADASAQRFPGAEKIKPREQRLMDMASQVVKLARNWDWPEVDRVIRIGYGLLHSEAPQVHNDDHGYAFHRGEHPIQAAMKELEENGKIL